jgi:hypothetical protein
MAQEIDLLIKQLNGFQTRAAARQQLQLLGAAAGPSLLPLLRDENAPLNARWAAIKLVGQYGYIEAVSDLLNITRTNLNLRGESCRALEQITGKELGEDIEAWERELNPDAPKMEAADEPPAENPESTAFAEIAPAEAAEAAAPAESAAPPANPILDLVTRALQKAAQEISWDEDGDYALVRMPLKQGRKQQMAIMEEDGVPPTLKIYTECGAAPKNAKDLVCQRNLTLHHGKFVIETDESGQGKIVMEERQALVLMNAELLRETVLAMAQAADDLEYELTQSDRI